MPKGVAKIAEISGEAGRFGLNGVQVSRQGDELTAAATDGKRLVVATWSEERVSPLPGFAEAEKPVKDYRALIPASALRRAAAAAKGLNRKPAAVVIDEPSTNGTVKVLSLDWKAGVTTSIGANVVEAKFPPYEDIIPDFEVVEEVKTKAKGGGKAVRIGVSADLLAGLLLAMLDAAGGDKPVVEMQVPLDRSKPIKFIHKGHDVQVLALLMPAILSE